MVYKLFQSIESLSRANAQSVKQMPVYLLQLAQGLWSLLFVSSGAPDEGGL